MLKKRSTYQYGRHFYRLILLALPLFLLGSCKTMFSWLRPKAVPQEEVCWEPWYESESANRYYDSLRVAESRRFHDSCEWVLQAEWDSVLRSLAPTVTFTELLADSIIDYARTFMGVPYVHGGNGPKKFDCSGFTLYVFKHFGYKLRRTVPGQLEDGWKRIEHTNDLHRGDLVFFGGRKNPRKLGHVAIVVDNEPEEKYFTFIHATVKLGITVSRSDEKYYRIRYMGACRILPDY